MRFIHLADVHLADNSTFDNSLGHIIRENTWKSFEQIFINNKDTDFALIAGDLFERSFSHLRISKIFLEFLKIMVKISTMLQEIMIILMSLILFF